MTKEPVIGLYPLNDCVLVELKQSSKNFSVKEGKYDTRTEGIVVALPKNVATLDKGIEAAVNAGLIGKRVHFEEFKEGARIKRDGKIYSFIKIEDIRGYEIE
jgi:co-chaperonin GroES (HSP10)